MSFKTCYALIGKLWEHSGPNPKAIEGCTVALVSDVTLAEFHEGLRFMAPGEIFAVRLSHEALTEIQDLIGGAWPFNLSVDRSKRGTQLLRRYSHSMTKVGDHT